MTTFTSSLHTRRLQGRPCFSLFILPAIMSVLATVTLAQNEGFFADSVQARAKALSEEPYSAPEEVDNTLLDLSYDQYRQIRFRKDAALWADEGLPFTLEFFPPGHFFSSGVEVNIIDGAEVQALQLDTDAFSAPTEEVAAALQANTQVAGFRLHFPINRKDYKDEFAVFLGASYFRAVSSGQDYGLSARGLAIDVAEPTGEEFPFFRAFWVEKPAPGAEDIVIHALMDSPGATGAYRFLLAPNAPTEMTVEAVLYPRKTLSHIGIAPLTSMYLFGAMDASDTPDYRVAVHDSEGLAMLTGAGETLWRPLINPADLQVSAFSDENPRGFGLIQRHRDLDDYQDLEAKYHTRPSVWVLPQGKWGKGQLTLVEIPTDTEVNDNIVAYWRPQEALEPGQEYRYAYQLLWPDDNPLPVGTARIRRSASGLKLHTAYPQLVVDYEGLPEGLAIDELEVDASVSRGRVMETVTQANQYAGARVFVTFDPEGAEVSEMRIALTKGGVAIGEILLFRWVDE